MDNAKPSQPPWNLEFRSSKKFVITVVSIAVFTDFFIYGMVGAVRKRRRLLDKLTVWIVPILPDVLRHRLGIPDDQLQAWMSLLLAAFGGAIFIGSPTFGYLADKGSSRQLPFIIGLLALGGSTVMFWFARTIEFLVVARILQGLSASVVWTVGLTLTVDTVGKEEVGVAMGYVSMAMTVGTVFGPSIGGFLISRAGYHSVFTLAIVLIVLDIFLRLVMIERKTAAKWIPMESDGDETEGLMSGAIGQGASQYEYFGEASTGHEVSAIQPRDEIEPMASGRASVLPGMVRLMCSGHLLIVLGATVVDASLYSSFDTVLPLHVMRIFKWGPLGIGICFLPLFTPSFLSAVIGNAVDRYGARTIALLGFVFDFPVFVLLSLITTNTTQDQILLYIFLFFAGLASVLQMVALMADVHHIVSGLEKQHPGVFGPQGGTAQAYGLYNGAWSCGQMLGPLVAGFLVDKHGWSTMVTAFGVMSAVVAMVYVGVYGRKGLKGV